jgi:hypothetical protein
MIDKGGVLRGALRAASDAFYQAALNTAHNGPSVAHAGGSTPADQKNGNPPPPPPPPPH